MRPRTPNKIAYDLGANELEELYNKHEYSEARIAEIFDVNQTTIHYWLKKMGIERRPYYYKTRQWKESLR